MQILQPNIDRNLPVVNTPKPPPSVYKPIYPRPPTTAGLVSGAPDPKVPIEHQESKQDPTHDENKEDQQDEEIDQVTQYRPNEPSEWRTQNFRGIHASFLRETNSMWCEGRERWRRGGISVFWCRLGPRGLGFEADPEQDHRERLDDGSRAVSVCMVTLYSRQWPGGGEVSNKRFPTRY